MDYYVKPEDIMQNRRGRIDWRKDPIIEVRNNKATELRKQNLRHCGKILKRLMAPVPSYWQPEVERTLPPIPPSIEQDVTTKRPI